MFTKTPAIESPLFLSGLKHVLLYLRTQSKHVASVTYSHENNIRQQPK